MKNACTFSMLHYNAKHFKNMSGLSLHILILSLLKTETITKVPKVEFNMDDDN